MRRLSFSAAILVAAGCCSLTAPAARGQRAIEWKAGEGGTGLNGVVPVMPFDYDLDGDVDDDDMQVFRQCVTGSGVPGPPQGCPTGTFNQSDVDGDGDVDMSDWGAIQVCYSGSFPYDPQCLQNSAGGTTAITYTLELGGDNHLHLWKNPPGCNPELFAAGSTYDDQSYVPNSIITWAARGRVSGVSASGFAPSGAANLVFNLELHSGTDTSPGSLVPNFGRGNATAVGFFSSINDGGNTGTRFSSCGYPADPLEAAAFTVGYSVDSFAHGRVIDDPGAGGPYLDFFSYPTGFGFPSGSTIGSGILAGMGAGYSRFRGYGCPTDCGFGPGFNTAGVGRTSTAIHCGSALGEAAVFEGQINTSGLALGTYTVALVPLPGNNAVRGDFDCEFGDPGPFAERVLSPAGDTISFTLPCLSPCSRTIADANRRVFYNNSFYDSAASACTSLIGQTCNDNTAIATDKTALNPGQAATTANYISFNKSLNGLMIDVTPGPCCNPLPAGPLSASNFDFKIANSQVLGTYVAAPAPISIDVTPGGGAAGSDRIKIIWSDNAIPNTRWLRVVVKSNASGGSIDLDTDNIFYYGIAIGESLTPSATRAIVNSTDEIDARNHPHNSLSRVPVATNSTYAVANAPDAKYDYDKNSTVSSTDEIIARNNPANSINGLLLLNPAP